MTALFTVPIPSTGGTIICTNPPPTPSSTSTISAKSKPKPKLDTSKIYILTFTSPPDNRLTPAFISAFLLALDILEHRFPKGVVVTTSGIAKFYSNGLDLQVVNETEGFLDRWLWKVFRRLVTYPMPTISLLNGHAFAGGLMLSMYHDYRIMNPSKGFVCLNELDFGVPLQSPMMAIFRAKLTPTTFRDLVLEAKRVPGPEALKCGIVDGLGGIGEVVEFIGERGLEGKAGSGIYGLMKEEMYRGVIGVLDDHEGNLAWRDGVEGKKGGLKREGLRDVEEWERREKKAKL
ncbi:ClpP/crotonase-like domain-containing protein [Aspergillus cavernicola]|uniref:ClpP/crotonase-like domain-containing protein n=1 Tax=Aspergillus cavernicola TaxID=176166 RepID=A0ABR4HPZ4_9EURO